MDDLISRKAAIEEMRGDKVEITRVIRAMGEAERFETFNATCERHAKMLEKLPTIEERKTGRWIVYPAPDEQHCGLVKCPYCQEELIAEPTEYHYCPSCGAKLEVENDSN